MAEDNITGPLLVAMLAVHGKVKPLAKSARNEQGKFDYAPADAVIAASRILLHSHGLGWIKTGQRMLPPALASGDIGRRCYVGECEISGFLYHAESEGLLNVVSQIPVVAMSATPHDKAAAASSTFGAGYMWLGILNADREGEHSQVNDREDHGEPPGDRTPTLRERVITQVGKVSRDLRMHKSDAWYECLAVAELPSDLGGNDGPTSAAVTDKHLAALLKASHDVLRAGVSDGGAP